MKVDFYASSVSGVYLLLVLDSAICAFGNAVDSPGASQPTELALLVLQAPRTICRPLLPPPRRSDRVYMPSPAVCP